MPANQSTNEHNVVNLGELISNISTFKAKYSPTRSEFIIESLRLLKEKSEAANEAVTDAEITLQSSQTARSSGFIGFDPLITRVINALRISGASAQSIAQAEAIVRDLRGKRASAIASDEDVAAAKEKGTAINQITRHINTFESKYSNFLILIIFLGTIPVYKPNEEDLSVTSLNARYISMKNADEQCSEAQVAIDAARANRDKVLYAEGTGMVDIALGVKTYVKSAFGASSNEYMAISSIAFIKR